MRRFLLGAAVLLGLCGAVAAEETTVPRYLEFRDGSVIKLPVVDEEWKVTLLRADGKLETSTVRLSSLDRLLLMPEPVLEQKKALLEVIRQLGADKFLEREQAQDRLIKMGAGIRADLLGALDVYTDLEIRSRIEQILAKMPPLPPGQQVKATDTFDHFFTRELLHGDAGEGSIPVRIDGQTRRLGRKDVRGLSVKSPDPNELPAARRTPAGFRRIEAADFPPGCLEESFETAPSGRKLVVGENIEKLFISKGFTLSTSIGTSFVSVNDFVVHGKSRGLSAATHQPLFQGQLTIRFCKPGNENVPAGVTHFGLWIAHVMPRGTAMVAYDLQGRELGRIETTREGHEFLGIQSSVPIHRIVIVPNLQIDPDYTLDDFIYLLARGDTAHPEKHLVQFADGERVLCSDVSFAQQNVRLHGLPAGLPDRTRPAAELLRVATPDKDRQPQSAPAKPRPGVFVELRDGSVIFGAASSRGPTFARRPDVLKDRDNIVGLWSTEWPRTLWPAKFEQPVIWDTEKRTWRPVADVALTEEAVAYTQDEKRRARSYFELGPLLLRQPAGEPAVGSWRVRTVQGEEIVLGKLAAPPVGGTLSKELEAKWGEVTLKIPAAEVVSVFKVIKE
jgi:hypothetical protein